MSIAGVQSSRGDAYQVLVAVDWAIRALYDPVDSLEADSTSLDSSGQPVVVDDVVVRFVDGTTTYVQTKKNQPKHQNWTPADLKDDLIKAGHQLARDPDATVIFYSRNNFGDLTRLRDRTESFPDEASFLHDLPKDLVDSHEELKNYWQSCLGAGESARTHLRRIHFRVTADFAALRTEQIGLLRRLVTRAEEAHSELYKLMNEITQRVPWVHGSSASAGIHRLSRADLFARLAAVGAMVTPPKSQVEVENEFRRMSAVGRDWQRKIGGVVLQREHVRNEALRLIEEKPRTLLIHDGSGFGKSCLLLDLHAHLANSASKFALYLQGRVYSSTGSEAERTVLGLSRDLIGLVARAAEHRHTVVIIDSLDVLSLNREAALGFFLSLIDQIAVLPNVTVVAACRTFDLRYDSRLAHREWTKQLTAGPLDWTTEVQPLLAQLKIPQDTINDKLRRLITNPRMFAQFVAIDGCGERPMGESEQELTEQYLEAVVLRDPAMGELAMDALSTLAGRMVQERRLAITAISSGLGHELQKRLRSAEIVVEVEQGRLTFGHQTLLDVLAVRNAARHGLTFDQFVLAQPQTPFVRPSVRAFLVYLRLRDPEHFNKQIRAAVSSDSIAFHLKRLMAESLADLEPSDSDWPLLQHLLQAQRALFESFLSRIHSVGWFDLLAQHWIPQLLDQRDDEMLTNLAARYVLLRDSHPQKMIGFWQSLLSLDWFESRRLQSIIALELRDFRAWATPGAMDLLQLVLKSERETLASSALCRYVQETDSRDDLLWGYIITDVATLPPESHEFGSRLRCGPNDPSLPEFLLKRMAQSDALLNLVLDSIERWSVARLAASAAKAAWDELFLSATSFGRIHEANQNNYVESDKVLLGALETACLKRAETGTAWWRNNEARLRKSTDGALRYIALVAHERYPQHAGTAVAEMLRDAELLSSIRLRTEVNRLIRVAFVELNQPDQDLIQSHTLKWASEYIESEAEMLAMRRDRLAVIPTFMRTQEAQECLGLARRELGSAEGVPHTETYGGGWMVSPVSASELVALSGPSLVQLMKFLKPNNDRTQPTLESLAFDQVGSQLTLAASLDPDHFLEVLRSQTSELSLIDRAAILEGVSNHLRYRFGNVKSSAPWNPAATPNGAVLSAALLKVLHSDWHCWIRTLTAARALAACANVLDLAAEGRQFAALVSDMADAPGTQNANDNRSELLNRALNDVAGIAAEACAIVIRRLGETSAQISNSLGASFERFAAHENAPVRAMVVHQLPAIQFYFPQFGWKCFELAVEKAVFGIWQEAEHCLYYAYHDRFDLVEPYLERLRISRPPDTGDIWGRISTLCVLSGHIGLDTLLQQIEELSDPLAWKGVATVFATNAHQAQHRPLCHSGLESILKVTAAAAVVRSEMIYLFRATPAAPIPAVLLESYFETYSQDTPTQRTPLHDFQKWLVARAEFSAQEALDAIAIAIRKYINPPPYAWDVELYPTVLTRLFREGEDVESIDNGAFLKRVIRVQDELIRVSDQRIDHWLAEAERS